MKLNLMIHGYIIFMSEDYKIFCIYVLFNLAKSSRSRSQVVHL